MLLEKTSDLKAHHKHVCMISFDIQGAFDRIQWPIILNALRAKGTPDYLQKTINSYLSDRFVLLNETDTHRVSMGCPQGSCFGPVLWNLVADSALKINLPVNTHLQAYADDFALLIGGASRRALETSANEAIASFYNWSKQNQLVISTDKTCAIAFGKYRRKPTLKLDGNSIPVKKSLKYLGVTLDKTLSWLPHIAAVKQQAIRKSSMLLRMAARTWGITPKLLRTWYQAVPEKILLYCCSTWYPTTNSHGRRALISAQRHFLLQITRAARNISNNALNILANIPPIDLQATKLSDQGRFIRLGQDLLGHSRRDYTTPEYRFDVHPAAEDLPHQLWNPPKGTFNQAFTDGSKLEGRVGSAFVFYTPQGETYVEKKRLRDENSVFQAELQALQDAVDWSQLHRLPTWIQTDSASCLAAINHVRHPDPAVARLKQSFRSSSVPVHITWIKAHAGHHGNEAADTAAKEATKGSTSQEPLPKLPHSHIRRLLKVKMFDDWQERWTNSDTGRDLHRFITKVSDAHIITDRHLVAFFSGRGPFPAVLHRHGLCDDPRCVCGLDGTPLHYILECPFTTVFHLRKAARTSMQDWCEYLYKDYYSQKTIHNLCVYLRENENDFRYIGR